MLEIKFWRIENSIAMKILEQGEEIERCGFVFKASNGITILSCHKPAIARDYIGKTNEYGLCIRGDNEDKDNNISTHDFDDVETAKRFLKMYVEATKEYNNSLSLQKSEDIGKDIEVVIAE